MAFTGSTSGDRPLFDRSQPHGVVYYPHYRIPEVAQILGIGVDKTRSLFRDGYYGPVIRIENQRHRPHKRNHTTILVPYATLIRFLNGESVATA